MPIPPPPAPPPPPPFLEDPPYAYLDNWLLLALLFDPEAARPLVTPDVLRPLPLPPPEAFRDLLRPPRAPVLLPRALLEEPRRAREGAAAAALLGFGGGGMALVACDWENWALNAATRGFGLK